MGKMMQFKKSHLTRGRIHPQPEFSSLPYSENKFFLVTLFSDNNIKSLIDNSINLPHAQMPSWLKEVY